MADQQQAETTSTKTDHERVASTSGDVLAEQVAKLAALFPEAVVEGQVDFDKLKATLGGAAEPGPGRFSFTWAGKDDAISLLQTPTRGTLVPCPEQSVNFDATANAFIEGENLEVLKLLFKPCFGRVKLIYIDPPYNTGQDFVYPDDFADPLHNYLVQTGQLDDAGNLVSSKVDRAGRVHSAWLSMLYPRLFLARQLLRDDGLIFVSIDDNEVHRLRLLLDEVFGEENFLAQLTWKKVYGGGSKVKYVVGLHEYILVYARDKSVLASISLPPDPNILRLYKFKDEKFDTRGPYYTQPLATTSMEERRNLRFPIHHQSEEIWPEKQWQWSRDRVEQAQRDDELVFKKTDGKWSVRYKQYLRDEDGTERGTKPFSILDGPYTQEGTDDVETLFGDNKVFPFPKPVALIKQLLRYAWSDKRALILDFFGGSCTTAQAVLELNREDGGNRRFILIQLPEATGNADFPTIAQIGAERIRRVLGRLRDKANDGLNFEREQPEDLGFKMFKLSEPAIRPWSAGNESRDPDAYADRLSFYNDPLSPDAKGTDVVWEVALREGYSLATTMDPRELPNGNVIWTVTDPDTAQRMMVCLDPKVRADLSKQLELTPDTLLVVRDVALDDTAAANLALQCRLKTI